MLLLPIYLFLILIKSLLYHQIHQLLYIVIILDLFARKVVSWQTSFSLKKEFVIECFLKAYWQRKPAKGLILKSDSVLTLKSSIKNKNNYFYNN